MRAVPQRQVVPTASAFLQHLQNNLNNTKEGSTRPLNQLCSWNLGLRLSTTHDKSLTSLVSQTGAYKYTEIYFDKVHPVYGFVDRVTFEQKLKSRWLDSRPNEYDAVICGVLALGSLFAGMQPLSRETDLVELAKTVLDAWNPIPRTSSTSLERSMAYILRVLYMPTAMDPHSAWIASRSAIANLEEDLQDSGQASDVSPCCSGHNRFNSLAERELHSRLHWVATALHTWISNEYAPIHERKGYVKIACPPSAASESNDQLPSLITIFQFSPRLLDVPKRHTLPELTSLLESIDTIPSQSIHHVIQLVKSSYALCIYRFMRQTGSVIPQSTLPGLIRLGKPALAAALRLAQDSQPWWHVVHVPFQFLCVLLSIDKYESLVEVQGTMVTLRAIERCFVGMTDQMHNVIAMAEALLKMCQRSKDEAAKALACDSQDHMSGLSDLTTPSTSMNSNTYDMSTIFDWTEHDLEFGPFDLNALDWGVSLS
jgi:hypothetical protein